MLGTSRVCSLANMPHRAKKRMQETGPCWGLRGALPWPMCCTKAEANARDWIVLGAAVGYSWPLCCPAEDESACRRLGCVGGCSGLFAGHCALGSLDLPPGHPAPGLGQVLRDCRYPSIEAHPDLVIL